MRYLTILLIALLAGCGYKAEAPRPAPVTAAPAPAPAPVTMTRSPVPETVPMPENSKPTKVEVEDSVTKHLFTAAISFVIPDTANIKDDIKAQLLIDPSKDAFALSKELRVKGKVTESKIKISRIALAKLTATDFDVTPITPEQQALTMNEPTEWLWELKPKTAGDHDILLTITAIVKIDGDSTEHTIKTFEKTLKVKITTQQLVKAWFDKYWQWLVSTLLIPLAIWVYKEKIKKS